MKIVGVVAFPCGHEMDVDFWKTLQNLSAYREKPIEVTCRQCNPAVRHRWIPPSDGEWRQIESKKSKSPLSPRGDTHTP